MEAPGTSVFQGAGSLVIDNASQRQEEEECLVEEQNRKAELENVMKTAFEDLEDDDNESSITSSHYSSRHDFQQRHSFDDAEDSSCERSFQGESGMYRNRVNIQENFAPARLYGKSIGENQFSNERLHQLGYETPPSDPTAPFQNVRVDLEVVTEGYKQSDVNSLEQLQILYDVRMREIERLRKENEAERRSKDQVLRKLAVSETEKQEIISSLTNNQSLLHETSEKVKALNREVATIQEELKEVTKEKDETKHELDIAKLQILQQEQQIALLEKCGGMKNQDKHIDNIVENLKERHKREICSLKKELDDALAKIRLKEESYKLLEGRLEEVEKKHVAVLLNKCDSTVRQEAAVKALLDEANSEKVQLTKKIRALESDVETLSKDLEFYENLSKNKLLSSTSSGEMDDNDMSPSYGRAVDQKSLSNMDLLKSELNRALIGQKEKRMTIRKLQESVQQKEIQIAQMREQEKIYLTETEKLKGDMAAVIERFEKGADEGEKRDYIEKISRLELLISALDKEKNEKSERVGELEKEVAALQGKVKEHEDAAKKLVEDYMAYREQEIAQLKMENEEISKSHELEWRGRMERLLGECDEIKRLYLDMRSARDEAVEKLEEEKKKYSDCLKNCRALEERVKSLKQQVSDLEDHILSIEEEKDDILRQQGGRDAGARKSDYIVKQLREEIAVLKNLSQAQPQTFDPADLQRLRDEVSAAKKRYLELESTLKTEFESNVLALKLENDKLKSELRNYEVKLAAIQDVGTQTETTDEPARFDRLYSMDTSRSLEDVEKLHSELERLRELEIRRCEEIMVLKASFQQKLHERMDELETKLLPHSQDDIDTIKEQVRTITTKFYVNEMAKLRDLHKAELEAMSISKEEEREKVLHLESELKLKLNELQAVENLKVQLAEQQKTIHDVKTRTALIISNCAKEFEEVKSQKEELVKKLDALTAKSQKYKEAAFKYKKLFEQLKANDLPQKYQRLVALVESKESEIITKIQEVAEAYQSQHDPFRNHPPI